MHTIKAIFRHKTALGLYKKQETLPNPTDFHIPGGPKMSIYGQDITFDTEQKIEIFALSQPEQRILTCFTKSFWVEKGSKATACFQWGDLVVTHE